MRKFNYLLVNGTNIIKKCWTKPILNDFPILELPDEIEPIEGFDQIINGKLIHDEKAYAKYLKLEEEKEDLIFKLNSLKLYLEQTDFKAIKFAEGLISSADYEEVKIAREEARVKIRLLQEQLEKLKNKK